MSSGQHTSFEFELRVEKAKAERLGFTFSRMASYFSSLMMSKHEYDTKYIGDTFVIGMRETAAQLNRIMEFSLTTDKGTTVRVKDLCTVHYQET
jgi:multidrug efflux pump subunit AcrB